MLTFDQERRVATWWRERNIRETCPSCDRDAGVDQELVGHPFYIGRTLLARTCRHCGVVTHFDAARILLHGLDWPNRAPTTATPERPCPTPD